MADFDKLIKNPEKCLLDRRHGIFIEHLAIFLDHLHNQKGILKLIMHRIVPLILDDLLEGSQWLGCEEQQELLVLLDCRVDEFADDVA